MESEKKPPIVTTPVGEYGVLAMKSVFKKTDDANNTSYEFGIPSGFDVGNENNQRALLPDINRIGEIACREQFFRQAGGIHTFNQEFSDLVNGYPKWAVLEYWDGSNLRRVMSLLDDNTANFVDRPDLIDNIHWAYCDVWNADNMRIYYDFSSYETIVADSMTTEYDCMAMVWVEVVKSESSSDSTVVSMTVSRGSDESTSDIVEVSNPVSPTSKDYHVISTVGRFLKKGTTVSVTKSGTAKTTVNFWLCRLTTKA